MSGLPGAQPIGVFDSGLGGLTVLKELMAELPHEDTIYFGDSGRAPYGTKSAETVTGFSLQIARYLLQQQVKMIIIACNTASSHAFAAVARLADVPVIEVVGPGAAAAVATSQNKRIGVIGTRGTVNSGVYLEAIRQRSQDQVRIFQQACPLFVGLAEEGWWDLPVTREIARIYLQPLLAEDIDTLVLGCTHYPLLENAIRSVSGSRVQLVNAGRAVARKARQELERLGLLNGQAAQGRHLYYTSDSAMQFASLGSKFLAETISGASRIDIERY